MRKVNVFKKLGAVAVLVATFSLGACNSAAPTETETEETQEETTTTEVHDHDHDSTHDHSDGEEHPAAGDGGSEHPN